MITVFLASFDQFLFSGFEDWKPFQALGVGWEMPHLIVPNQMRFIDDGFVQRVEACWRGGRMLHAKNFFVSFQPRDRGFLVRLSNVQVSLKIEPTVPSYVSYTNANLCVLCPKMHGINTVQIGGI